MKKNFKFFAYAVFLVSALSACGSGFHFTPQNPEVYQSRTPDQRIKVFYDTPSVPHEVIGVYELGHYQPGWSSPTIQDTLSKLRSEVSRVGGDAFVIRHNYPTGDRTIFVAGDVVRFK